MSRLSRIPFVRLWSRSLPFQVVMTTLAAAIVILFATGWFLMEQSSRGIMAGKTQASVAEASAVVTTMQRDLSTTDLRTTSASERIIRLATEATNRGTVGNQYFVVVETQISQIGTPGLAPESIPDSIRERGCRGRVVEHPDTDPLQRFACRRAGTVRPPPRGPRAGT